MYDHGLIGPVIALVCWSLVVMAWLGYERVRNILRLRLSPDAGKFARDLDALMPDRARQVSANYMHLMEQPTIFYAVCLSLQFIGREITPSTSVWRGGTLPRVFCIRVCRAPSTTSACASRCS